MDLVERLRGDRVLVLDGATGTELERRGARTGLPLWSTHALIEAPELVLAIHRDYVRAGAEILTANTFRTQERTLARAGRAGCAAELTARAVELAREASREAAHRVAVAGSAPTLEDCYRPDRVPDQRALAEEHAAHVANLVRSGVDLVLAETMNTVREALAAARAAREAGVPVVVSFVCGSDGALLSGEPLAQAVAAVAAVGPIAVGVNCLPPATVAACLPALRRSGLPFCVYANLGTPNDVSGFTRSEAESPQAFARHAVAWVRAGARIVGGCCGTQPAHVRAIVEALGRSSP
jgi:S-methylmethionine-dependent homocysteine/selenocysteine methylase